MLSRYFHDIVIAMESIMANKLKSVLTALGIIFGVAAVISMLAIGKGAQKEILEQMKLVGVNNIVVTPIVTPVSDDESSGSGSGTDTKEKRKFSPGLTLADVEAINKIVPTVKRISPEIALNSYVLQNAKREQAKLIGVSREYFDIYNLSLSQGAYFNEYQETNGIPVCIIGANIQNTFFPKENPIDQYIKFDKIWLKVIGVLQRNEITLTAFENTGVNVFNDNIYIPAKTMLMRFQNRALVSSRLIQSSAVISEGFHRFSISVNPTQNSSSNYHQLDKIVVQVRESAEITPTTELLSRMLFRRHEGIKDYEITVPELLLKQEERTKDIFNVVLGAIASISLLVGGIGIMNIMFASVMERIKEIGTRMAIGAKKTDIVVQFLSEAVLISITGGLIGVILGIILSKLITELANILTIISPFSVIIAFGVSASIGIIFGYSPAKRASEKDPIESLRYE
jgi:putative ABC transport system permease protein